MSKIKYYSDIKILKKNLKQRIKHILKIFLIFFIVACCFISASYLSTALTVGNLSALIVYGDTKLKVNESKLFAVVLGEYDSKDEAENVALGSTVQGASGYIWEDGKYWVVGNIYESLQDAQKVIENLRDSKYAATIKEIFFPKLIIDFSMYVNEDMYIINNAFDIFDKIYNTIYDYSIKYDKKEITHLAVSSYVSELRGEIKSIMVNVQNLINKSSSKLKQVQTALVKIDELLDQTIIKTIDNSSTNYSLKYAIASVVRIKYDLFTILV